MCWFILFFLSSFQLTLADLAVYNIMTSLYVGVKEISDKLAAHFEKIDGLPKIKAWVENRPQTQM